MAERTIAPVLKTGSPQGSGVRIPLVPPYWVDGEIGKRVGLKIRYREVYGFDSHSTHAGQVAKQADALGLGPSAERYEGSTPSLPTITINM